MAKRKAQDPRASTNSAEPWRSRRRIAQGVVSTKKGKVAPTGGARKSSKRVEKKSIAKDDESVELNEAQTTSPALPSCSTKATALKTQPSPPTAATTDPTSSLIRQYWLMKAEPESRLEKGHDVKFSIDDLATKTEPEPWDGIRAYPARNNLRAMKKGDLAFFYHSSCKVPAIVGVMEIVKEHEPDLSAHNPALPYYDAASSPSNPKWSLVHVSFRQKLNTPITLKNLREWQEEKDSPLKEMMMLKQTRLSVSRVSEEEWRFLINKLEDNNDIVKE